jgi:protein-disulfide isomerase
MNKNLPALIIGLVAIIAIVSGVYLYQNSKADNAPVAKNSSNAAPTLDKVKTAPPGAEPAWSKGAPNATVTLEEFADFECPSCGMFEPTMREIKTVYGNRVRVIFRQYPLQMHQHAYDAARAAEAAGLQGKFWEMHDMLYDKQKSWSKEMPDARKEFEGYAKALNLNVDKFNNDLTGETANNRVAADKKRGDFIGIRATPSLFLNGRLLTVEEMQIAKLRELIEIALQGK